MQEVFVLPVKVIAPGRVNLIGEHTDYNEGFVMPVAIEPALYIEASARPGRVISARADGLGQAVSFSLERLLAPPRNPSWIDYLKGVCWALEGAGYSLQGAYLDIKSTIPIGAGLSSSAALELGTAAALLHLAGLAVSLEEMALLCQRAENQFVGVRCGIMDQFTVALGRTGQALLLDCRSLTYEYIPLDLDRCRLLIVDSRVRRSLVASEYNRRRAECEAAVKKLAVLLGRPLRSLRDLSLAEIKGARSHLPEALFKRSLYVAEENGRVIESAAALRGGDLVSFGRQMGHSHAGLRDLYQVSCPQLDLIVEAAAGCPGVLGARMTGAGFGGCAVVLLEEQSIEPACETIREAFNRQSWMEPRFYLTSAVQGVSVEACA